MRSEDLRRRGSTGFRTRAIAPCKRSGLTIVEIVVALSILVVAASIFGQMLVSTSRLRQLNRENTQAADSARVMLERMRNEPFLEVFRDYNEDPKDDPGGQGTGPGQFFDVEGLSALDDAPQGKVGRVIFPSTAVQVMTTPTQGGGKVSGPIIVTQIQLREDYQDKALGMPRDLNGNNVVDTADHASDYFILPVRVEIRWKGRSGARKFEIVTQLADFRKEDLP